MPAVMAGLLVFMRLSFWLSPRNFKLDEFRSTYAFLALAVTALLGYMHVLMLWSAMAGAIEMPRALMGGVFLFFALIGSVMSKIRRNFWAGVRTPWTLASERVWNDTHRLAGWVFVLAGVVGFVAVVSGLPVVWAIWLLIAAAAVPVVYSLIHYKRLDSRGEV